MNHFGCEERVTKAAFCKMKFHDSHTIFSNANTSIVLNSRTCVIQLHICSNFSKAHLVMNVSVITCDAINFEEIIR